MPIHDIQDGYGGCPLHRADTCGVKLVIVIFVGGGMVETRFFTITVFFAGVWLVVMWRARISSEYAYRKEMTSWRQGVL